MGSGTACLRVPGVRFLRPGAARGGHVCRPDVEHPRPRHLRRVASERSARPPRGPVGDLPLNGHARPHPGACGVRGIAPGRVGRGAQPRTATAARSVTRAGHSGARAASARRPSAGGFPARGQQDLLGTAHRPGRGAEEVAPASRAASGRQVSAGARMTRALLRLYQLLSAGRASPCRFDPSCSAYAVEAVEVHGAVRGLWLAVRRLLRCHPWGGQGWDPVPVAKER